MSRHLVSMGHKVIILTPISPHNELARIDFVTIESYPAIFIPKIRYAIPLFFSQLALIKRVVARDQINIIHIWSYAYATVWIPFIYGKFRHIPVVITTDNFAGRSWQYGSCCVDFIANIYTKSIGKLILSSCDKLILLSKPVLETARAIGIKEENMMLIPNGVDPINPTAVSNTDVRKRLGIETSQKVILNVGRLVPVKGIETLIMITEALLKGGFDVKTIIVGDGPYRKNYEASARHLGDKIIFTGFRRDVPELMSACDIFVLPSLSEGLPNVLLEAAVCGKPMVASNVGGISDIIIHGKTGFLAPPKNVKLFVHYIELILSDNKHAKLLGSEARKHVIVNFNWERIASKMESVYSAQLTKRLSK